MAWTIFWAIGVTIAFFFLKKEENVLSRLLAAAFFSWGIVIGALIK